MDLTNCFSIATSYLVGNNRDFDVSGIFWGVLFIVGGGKLMTIEDPSLSDHDYQLLPIATSYLVCYNSEFDVSDIFWGVLFIVGGGELKTIEDWSLSAHGYWLFPQATSQ